MAGTKHGRSRTWRELITAGTKHSYVPRKDIRVLARDQGFCPLTSHLTSEAHDAHSAGSKKRPRHICTCDAPAGLYVLQQFSNN